MAIILGIDDAGRGPLIGPMILAGVLMERDKEAMLKKQGVKDSKQLTQNERVALSKIIESEVIAFKVVKSFPDEIDEAVSSKSNLNTLEAKKAAQIINELNQDKFKKEKITVVVDCPSTNLSAWKKTMLNFVNNPDNLEVHCEHKADVNHPSVSAASILAKCAREEEVAKLKKQYAKYGNIGSGYPADEVTIEFMKKHGKALKDENLFRKTWSTWKKLFPSKEQETLF